jgi:hypothetical protein
MPDSSSTRIYAIGTQFRCRSALICPSAKRSQIPDSYQSFGNSMNQPTGSDLTSLEELQGYLLNVHSVHFGHSDVFPLQLQLPALSNLKSEPTVISIDRLDIVLAEKIEEDEHDATPAEAPAASPVKAAAPSSSYGMGDKVWTHLASQNTTCGMVVSAWFWPAGLQIRHWRCKRVRVALVSSLSAASVNRSSCDLSKHPRFGLPAYMVRRIYGSLLKAIAFERLKLDATVVALQIADGVTIEVESVNLMLETLGAVRVGDTDSAAW